MSKGRDPTKRKWRDFRKKYKAYEGIAINCPNKFHRASKLLRNYEGSHISMKRHLYTDAYYFI